MSSCHVFLLEMTTLIFNVLSVVWKLHSMPTAESGPRFLNSNFLSITLQDHINDNYSIF